jgi:hypothetical protein
MPLASSVVIRVNPLGMQRYQAVGTVRAKMPKNPHIDPREQADVETGATDCSTVRREPTAVPFGRFQGKP